MKTRIIFVHGLGGDQLTWGKFPNLLLKDSDLDVSIDFMEYPTPFLGIKLSYMFQQKYQAIEDLAKSLKTLIDERHQDADEIILVGHSMGGLVIRKYLLEERVAERQTKVSKAVLYAVPNRGNGHATILKEFSPFRNPHLWQLSKYSDFIKQLNESWCRSKVEDYTDITVVVAGNDKVVTVDSAEGVFQHLEPKQIAAKGHLDVVKPTSFTDLSFLILKNAILKKKYIPEFPLQGACNFIGWQKHHGLATFDFCQDEKRKLIFHSLLAELSNVRTALRIKGLSGLGKTRLIYEAVLASSKEVQDKLLYINVATDIPSIKSWLNRVINIGYQGILVVDNCKPDLHNDLCEEVKRADSQILLVTLDHSPENVHDSKEYKIEKLDTSQIKLLLEKYYGGRISDLDRVAEFAQGFPRMAVLIAEARLSNNPEVGKLTDDQLAKKLLGDDIADSELKILQGCSLFDRFGLEGEVTEQYEYIANNVAHVTPSEFYRCVKKFQSRGLIDISGRYCQLVPKPLAVRLASEWWNETHKKMQLAFIEDIPDSLVTPFCTQVTMLGFIPEVRELTQTLCGPQGPFGQAEVILSNRGSLLLRSFAEINPAATASALYKTMSTLDYEALFSITGDVRRNLVWALEKLAFHAEVFDDAAWCLMLLASAENESWSNNATGMFVQLFRVYLSGTEADLKMRLRFLNGAMALNNGNVDVVLIKALNASIDSHGGYRTIGAEYQGAGSPLQEWRPKLWQEIFDYWDAAFEMLLNYIERCNENSQEAKSVIGHSIRQLVANGRVKMLHRAIVRVIEMNGRYWPEALDSIKASLSYDSKSMPKDGVDALNDWLHLLLPDASNLLERLKIVVVNPPWEHREDADGQFIDIAAQNAENLADEISANIFQLTEHIPLLLLGEQKKTFVFGWRLGVKSTNASEYFDQVVDALCYMDNPNLSFAKGLLSGISVNSMDVWNRKLEEFSSREDLIKFFPDMLCTGQMTAIHLSRLLALIRRGVLSSRCASIFSYGGVTSHLSSNDIAKFCLELSELDAKGAWVALDIMFMYCFGDATKFEENRSILKQLVTRVSLDKQSKGGNMDMYHWEEVVKKLLVSEGLPFCEDICRQLVAATNEKMDHGDIGAIKPLLLDMMRAYGTGVWPIFSEALMSAEPLQAYWLEQLLDRENSFSNVSPSVFTVLPLDFVIEWCKQKSEFAPLFVARCINVFEQDANGVQHPTAIFIALLENFGDLDGIGGALSANLGTRGWVGSLVPYLEADKAALAPLLQHDNNYVSSWVRKHISYLEKSIAFESSRDEEHKFGIY